MTKQRDKACKQDINRILLLDSDSLGFESFGFSILNCLSLTTTEGGQQYIAVYTRQVAAELLKYFV